MASRTPSQAAGAETESEGQVNEEPRKQLPEEKLQIRVRITGIQGLSEGDGPVTVAYAFDSNEFVPSSDDEPEPVPIAGETEPPTEDAPPNQIDFYKEHDVAPVGHPKHDDFLLDLIAKPFKFTVTGTIGAGDFKGVFDVGVQQLIWREHPDPDEDDNKIKDYPFVMGDFNVKKVVDAAEDGAPPTLEETPLKISACIELSDFAMTVEEGEESNVMTIVIEEMHNLPKAWSLEDGDSGEDDHAFAYQASYSIPSGHGIKEIVARPGKVIPRTPAQSEEDGEGTDGETQGDAEARARLAAPEPEPEIVVLQHTLRAVDASNEKKEQRVSWRHEYQAYMNSNVISSFAGAIRRGTKFAVDIKRMYKEEDKDYPYAAKYHGKSDLDLSQILEQDRTSVTVRSPVGPAIPNVAPLAEDETLAAEKEQVLHDSNITAPYLLYETYLVVSLSTLRPIVKKPPPPKPELENVSAVLPMRPPVLAYQPETGGEEAYKAELRNIIVDMTESYIKMQEKFQGDPNDPMTLKRAQEDLLTALKSKSVGKWHDFKSKLKAAVFKVVKERFHQTTFGGVTMDTTDKVGKLNAFLREEMNEALARAFSAKKSFLDEPSMAVLKTLLNEELRLAVEAEMRMDYHGSCLHLSKRILAAKDAEDKEMKATLWYDLGTVTCRSGDDAKAEECFFKAINEDTKHINANLALGTLMCKRNNYREAEKYFRQASDGTYDVLAWSCCVVFFDLESKEQERKACVKQLSQSEKKTQAGKVSAYLRAGKFFVELHATHLVERSMTQEFVRNGSGQDSKNADPNFRSEYENWSTTPNSTEELKVILGKAYLYNKQYAKARMHLDDAMARAKDKKAVGLPLSIKGHTHYIEQGWHLYRCDREMPHNAGFPNPFENSTTTGPIEEFYNKALNSKPPYIDIEIYYRYARLLLASKKYGAAQRELLKACKLQPSATTWLGLAVACYREHTEQKYLEAEYACAEAMIIGPHNAEVWGMVCVIALQQILKLPEPNQATHVVMPNGEHVHKGFPPRLKEASEAMRRALAENLGVTEAYPVETCILEEAATLFASDKIREYDLAAAAVRQALSSVPDALSAQVKVTQIDPERYPSGKLIKGVDTVVLEVPQKDPINLSGLLKALQESHTEPSCVNWEFVSKNQRELMPVTAKRLYLKLASACDRSSVPDYHTALDAYDKAWQLSFVCACEEQERTTIFESIKEICDKMGDEGLDRRKAYISRMKPATRKTDTRGPGSTARSGK